MPPPPNLPAPWATGAPSHPPPRHSAPTGCPVNRVISHTHLDSCESGLPHPSRPAPNASLLAPRIPLVFLCGLRFDGWVLRAPGSRQVWLQPMDAPVLPLSILTPARPLCSGPERPGHLLPSPLWVSPLRTGSSSAALPMGHLLRGSQGPGSPLLFLLQTRVPWLPPAQDASWFQRAGPWASRRCHSVNLKQCQVNKTTFPTQERRAHKAAMSGHTGSSVSRPPRAACILGPRCAPPRTPPAGQSLLLGVLGLVASSWASVARQAPTERGVQVGKRGASLKADRQPGASVDTTQGSGGRNSSQPGSATDRLWDPGQAPVPLCSSVSSSAKRTVLWLPAWGVLCFGSQT